MKAPFPLAQSSTILPQAAAAPSLARMTEPKPSGDIEELLAIMKKLRDPDGGCPWDLEQDFATIAPYTIEEAYEVASAIEAGDYAALKDELGDLLLQVVFHAQMAAEGEHFAFPDVVRAICEKMIRRHPHVFGDGAAKTSGAVKTAWEDIKRKEREAKPSTRASLLDDVPRALPALMRAVKLQNRAATVGFDWPNAGQVADKIAEETRELAEAADSGNPHEVAEEFGDLLFAMANLARHLKLDPEDALRAANAKFMRRFKAIESGLEAQGKKPEEASLEEMEALWQAAKAGEK
jgi:MazG family protein